MQTIGIIGGSGFIGSFITKKFLSEGYRVLVSATAPSQEEKYRHLTELPGAERLQLKQLRVEDRAALRAFIQDCDLLVHCGTPFQLDVQDPKTELFDPTIEGTRYFLEAIQEAPQLKRVVLVASVAAYNAAFPMPAPDRGPEHVYRESDTPYIDDQCHPYAQAKFKANELVDQFVQMHPNSNVEIVSVSPTFVVGRPLSNRQDSTSVGMQFLFKEKMAPNPFVQMLFDQDVAFAMVDVEDVANCVFKAATTSGLHGKNYLLSSESWPVSDISRMLNKQPPQGAPKTVYSSALAERELGVSFNPPEVPLNRFA